MKGRRASGGKAKGRRAQRVSAWGWGPTRMKRRFHMRPIIWVAVNVFKESVRDRVLYNLVLFAVLLISSSYLIGQLTAGQDVKIIKDLGLSAISVFGLLIAVFIGIGLVWKEVERRSIYSLLSKPLARYEFVLGKYAGLALTLLVNVAIMTAAFYAVLAYMNTQFPDSARTVWPAPAMDPGMLRAVALIFFELLLVTALALFFSTFSTATLSATLTLGLYVIGHLTNDLKGMAEQSKSETVQAVMTGLYYLSPNLEALNVKGQAASGVAVEMSYLMLASAYGLLYTALLITAACAVFRRRDF